MVPTNAVISWIFSLMVQVAPPAVMAEKPQLPLHEETAEQKIVRYQEIATDLYLVTYDPSVTPIYSGPKGRALTALMVLGVIFHESGLAHDVDKGACFRGVDRGHDYAHRCDSGAAACLMQIEVGDGTTREGWSRNELFADHQKCFKAGLAMMRRSMSSCRAFPLEHRLGVYTGGSCQAPMAVRRSKELFGQARQFRDKAPLPGPDALFLPESDAPDS